jgi:hypothetical protein
MQTVTLTNDFHGTSVNLRCEVLSHIHNVSTIYPTAGQIKKAKKALCGIECCTCSGDAGTHGHQEHDGKRLIVDASSLYAADRH